MSERWIKVWSTSDPLQTEILKGRLIEEGLQAVVVNKQDSMYKVFGEAEIHVPGDQVLRAIRLIESQGDDVAEGLAGDLS